MCKAAIAKTEPGTIAVIVSTAELRDPIESSLRIME